jgi:hypothetical protein
MREARFIAPAWQGSNKERMGTFDKGCKRSKQVRRDRAWVHCLLSICSEASASKDKKLLNHLNLNI